MLLQLVSKHLRPYRRWVLLVAILQLVGTMATLLLPRFNANIIDQGILRGDTHCVLLEGSWMLAVCLLQVLCSITAVYFGARAAMSFGRDLRRLVFTHVVDLSAREMATFGAPSLITRNTNDVQQVQNFVLVLLTTLVMTPIMMVGGIVMAVHEDAGLSWLVAAAVPMMGMTLGLIVARMVPAFRRMQGRIDTINRVLREQARGIRVLRAFVREPLETERFAQANADLTEVSLTVGRWMAAMVPTVMLIMNVVSVAVLWFGGQRVGAGLMQIGSLSAYLAYLVQILMAVMMATFILTMAPRASVAAERIGEVLATDPSVQPPANPVTTVASAGHLDLRGVGFRYPGADRPVLEGVTVSARPGQTTAIIGSTGAGKSTLIGLISRLFDATEGSVLVDGIDVRELDVEVLGARVGLVPQNAYLFSGTVASNLRVGKPDATEDEMWAALEVAQARDFVEAMPDGLRSSISQGGTNVSGGQRQRLAIARAVIRRPAIYLFDDSFSALDVATDARLRRSLAAITRDATVIIVAQRVSTIANADQILVMEDGAIVGRGTHDELLSSNAIYAEIVQSQQRAEAA